MDEELKRLRGEIDAIDRSIVELLEKRVEAAKKIGALKAKSGRPVSDPAREKEVLENAAKSTRLDKEFIRGIFSSTIEYCKHAEKR